MGSCFFDPKIQTDRPFIQGAVNWHMDEDEVVCQVECCTMYLKRQLELKIGFTPSNHIATSAREATLWITPERNIVLYPWA